MSPTPNHDKPARRLESFDFLRGLSILAVVIVHTAQAFPSNIHLLDVAASFGRYGVQLVFFVSALTMSYIWQQRKDEKRPVLNFYIRRLFRIAPLFWLAILFYLFWNGIGPSYWAPEGVGSRQVILTATFLHGLWPDSINSVVPGGWSIAAEMTFYFLFPFLVSTFRDNKSRYLWAAFLVWLINVFFVQHWITDFFTTYHPSQGATIVKDFLNLNFLSQAPIFLVGCYLYFSLHTKISRSDLLVFAAWISSAVCAKFVFGKSGFGFFSVVFALGVFTFFSVKSNWKLKLLDLLGKNSYAIYLSHFFVLSILLKVFPVKSGIFALVSGLALTLAISYTISLVSTRLIENRIHVLATKLTKSLNVRAGAKT